MVVVVPSLEELTARVRREHDLVSHHGSQAVLHAIACGEACAAVKGLLPYGDFQHWLAREGYVPNTIQQYMRVARHKDVILHRQPSTIFAALRLLTGAERTDAQPPEIIAEVKRLRAGGATYREIKEETGLGFDAARNILDHDGMLRRRRAKYARSMETRRRLHREGRDQLAKRAGGGYSEAYSLIRRTAQILDRLGDSAEDQEVRRLLSQAVGSLHTVEDRLAKAMKLA